MCLQLKKYVNFFPIVLPLLRCFRADRLAMRSRKKLQMMSQEVKMLHLLWRPLLRTIMLIGSHLSRMYATFVHSLSFYLTWNYLFVLSPDCQIPYDWKLPQTSAMERWGWIFQCCGFHQGATRRCCTSPRPADEEQREAREPERDRKEAASVCILRMPETRRRSRSKI